jgi:hypothetical protein
MKTPGFLSSTMTVLCFASGALVPAPAAAQSALPPWEAGKWQFSASLNGFVPAIDGKVNYAGDTRSSDIHVSMRGVLSNLKMTFQGSLDVHNGRWGIFNDVVYANIGGVRSQTRDFSLGNIGIPATATTDLNLGVKATVWTVAGEYRVVSDPAWTVDLLAGARLLDLKTTLGFSINGDLGPITLPGRSGTKEVSDSLWDGIVGVKGRYTFTDDRKWFLPFYLDVGTGQTKLTWQAIAGVGYGFHWGDLVATYRYVDWNAKSGKSVESLSLGGPMISATWRW